MSLGQGAIPADEERRLASLRALRILDKPRREIRSHHTSGLGALRCTNCTCQFGRRRPPVVQIVRVMTVLFCDLKGFTSLSEGMTPQGLVKVMNRYLSTMSGPIRGHRGIIDKYIGDAIMAYWGPPFTEHAEQARLACLAAVEMADRGTALRTE